jgi:hypothetical protein
MLGFSMPPTLGLSRAAAGESHQSVRPASTACPPSAKMCLGARAGAVDLVGHQQLAEHRPGDEAEAAAPALGLLQHLRSEDVGGHQVGGELDALLGQPEHHAEGLDQPGLGEPGHADQQHMTAREQRDKRFLDDAFLAEDRAPDLAAHPREALDGRLDLVEDRRIMHVVHGPILARGADEEVPRGCGWQGRAGMG